MKPLNSKHQVFIILFASCFSETLIIVCFFDSSLIHGFRGRPFRLKFIFSASLRSSGAMGRCPNMVEWAWNCHAFHNRFCPHSIVIFTPCWYVCRHINANPEVSYVFVTLFMIYFDDRCYDVYQKRKNVCTYVSKGNIVRIVYWLKLSQ